MSKKEPLFTVTAADCRWDFFVGQGKGGQNKQKTSSACRCTHIASGAMGTCQDDRSQLQNKKKAFERMANTKEFQAWIRVESMRVSGQLALIEEQVEREMLLNTKVETKGEDGKWSENPDLRVKPIDLEYMKDD